MLIVPLDSLPPELRDLYTLPKGLRGAPLRDPDDNSTHSRRRIGAPSRSEAGQQDCLPLLHCSLTIPRKDMVADDWYDLMDALPNIGKHCDTLEVIPAVLQRDYPIIKWTTLIPHIIASMPRIERLYIVDDAVTDCSEILRASDRPSLRFVHITDILYHTDEEEMTATQRITTTKPTIVSRVAPAGAPQSCRAIQLSDVPMAMLAAAAGACCGDTSISSLHVCGVKGAWQASVSLSWLSSLVLYRCADFRVEDVIQILAASSNSLAYVAIDLVPKDQAPHLEDDEFDDGVDVVHLPQLERLSLEMMQSPGWERVALGELALSLFRRVSPSALSKLGLSNLPARMPSGTISSIIAGIDGAAELPFEVLLEPIEALDTNDEEADALNPFALVNLFASDRARVLAAAEYVKIFYVRVQ